MDIKTIQQAIHTAGSKRGAARMLGIPYSTLWDKLNQSENKVAEIGQHVSDQMFFDDFYQTVLSSYKRVELDKPDTALSVDLFISDTQAPFQHPDTIPFLRDLQSMYEFDRVFHVGDLVDNYNHSAWPTDPTMPNVSQELRATRSFIAELSDLFPHMRIVYGNHEDRLFRKAKSAGLPLQVLRNLNEYLGAPDTWEWANEFLIPFSNGSEAVLVHSPTKGVLLRNGVTKYGMSIICGHHHSKAEIVYFSTLKDLLFGMYTGSLINNNAKAFEYDKQNQYRPIISVGVVIHGNPQIIPMPLTDGRYDASKLGV